MQAAGASIMARKTPTAVNIGSHIVTGGIILQILWFGFFMLVAVVFNVRINKAPTARSASRTIPWRKHIHTLYLASALIMIRSIVRAVEYIEGFNGFILSHEAFLYVFDSLPMLCVMILLNVVHPSEVYALLRGGKMSRGGLKLYHVGQPSLAYN